MFASKPASHVLESFRPVDAVAIKEKGDEKGEGQLQGSLTKKGCSAEKPFSGRQQILGEVTQLTQ